MSFLVYDDLDQASVRRHKAVMKGGGRGPSFRNKWNFARGSRAAVFKKIGAGGTHSRKELRRQMDYINNKTQYSFGYSEHLSDNSKVPEQSLGHIADKWEAGWSGSPKNGHTSHLLMSFPPDTGAREAAMIAEECCERAFGGEKAFSDDRWEYIAALHTDREHPHVHIIVNNRGVESGTWFYLSGKPEAEFTYQGFRNLMVSVAREYGVELEATTRYERGDLQYSPNTAQWRRGDQPGYHSVTPRLNDLLLDEADEWIAVEKTARLVGAERVEAVAQRILQGISTHNSISRVEMKMADRIAKEYGIDAANEQRIFEAPVTYDLDESHDYAGPSEDYGERFDAEYSLMQKRGEDRESRLSAVTELMRKDVTELEKSFDSSVLNYRYIDGDSPAREPAEAAFQKSKERFEEFASQSPAHAAIASDAWDHAGGRSPYARPDNYMNYYGREQAINQFLEARELTSEIDAKDLLSVEDIDQASTSWVQRVRDKVLELPPEDQGKHFSAIRNEVDELHKDFGYEYPADDLAFSGRIADGLHVDRELLKGRAKDYLPEDHSLSDQVIDRAVEVFSLGALDGDDIKKHEGEQIDGKRLQDLETALGAVAKANQDYSFDGKQGAISAFWKKIGSYADQAGIGRDYVKDILENDTIGDTRKVEVLTDAVDPDKQAKISVAAMFAAIQDERQSMRANVVTPDTQYLADFMRNLTEREYPTSAPEFTSEQDAGEYVAALRAQFGKSGLDQIASGDYEALTNITPNKLHQRELAASVLAVAEQPQHSEKLGLTKQQIAQGYEAADEPHRAKRVLGKSLDDGFSL